MISAKTGVEHRGRAGGAGDAPAAAEGRPGRAPLKALLVDSWYDPYLGVIILVRIKDGRLRRGQKIRMMAKGAVHTVDQVGFFRPKMEPVDELGPGEIGYINAAIKTVADCDVGRHHHRRPPPGERDTAGASSRPSPWSGAAYSRSMPMISRNCGTASANCGSTMRASTTRRKARRHSASAFGAAFWACCTWRSFRSGLSREFDLDLIATAPSVVYHIFDSKGQMTELHNPADMPDPMSIDHIEEPWIRATIMVPDEHLGSVLTLCNERRGQQQDLTYVGTRAMAVYKLPLNEVVFDFYDRLKSTTRGYASFDYQMDSYAESDLVRISILVNQDPVDALSFIAHRSAAEARGRGDLRKAEGPHSEAVVQDRHSGGDRRTDYRTRDDRGVVEGRDGEVPMAVTSAASASCWRSRKRAKSGCGSSARSKFRRAPSWLLL